MTWIALLLVVALLGTIGGTLAMRGPWGPEGPVGAWLVLVFPGLIVAGVLLVFASRGMLDFLPGGRPGQFAGVVGMLVLFGTALFASLDAHNRIWPQLMAAVPYLILAGCFAIALGKWKWLAASTLGAAALAGWVLILIGITMSVRQSAAESAARVAEEAQREQGYEAEEVTEYRSLPADVPLGRVLRFTWSRNAAVKEEARRRVAEWPGRTEELVRLVDASSEMAIDYLALPDSQVTAELGPAWGRMMERRCESMQFMQYEEDASRRSSDLRRLFDGAEKIQRAGGDLKAPLRCWVELLKKSKHSGGMTAQVERLLR